MSSLPIYHKCVRPVHLQGDFESRKLWRSVTEALEKEDIDAATEHKRFVCIFVNIMYLIFITFGKYNKNVSLT